MRHLGSSLLLLIFFSCCRLDNKKEFKKLPLNFTFREIYLSDSLGFINLYIPNRYDTFYKFGYNPGCGLPIENQMYKFQQKKLTVFEESGMIDTAEPKIKDQLLISHGKYNASDTTNDSTIIYRYHQVRKHNIMMSPYHGILEKDFIQKKGTEFQSVFVMNLADSLNSVVHKEVIFSILRKKNVIAFDFLYVSNKNDSIADAFIKDALESTKTITMNNGY